MTVRLREIAERGMEEPLDSSDTSELCEESLKAADRLAALEDEVERLNSDILLMRENHRILCMGIKRLLGLEHWPDIEGRFHDGVIRLLSEAFARLRADLRTQNECIADQHDTIRGLRADAERHFTAAELSRIKTLLDNRPIDVHRDFYREELDEGIINKINAARADAERLAKELRAMCVRHNDYESSRPALDQHAVLVNNAARAAGGERGPEV